MLLTAKQVAFFSPLLVNSTSYSWLQCGLVCIVLLNCCLATFFVEPSWLLLSKGVGYCVLKSRSGEASLLAPRSLFTSKMLDACRPSITTESIWFLVLRTGDCQVALWILRCWNLVLEITMFCAAAKDTSLKPLSRFFPVQNVFPDCWAKNIFAPHYRVKVANQNFNSGPGVTLI